MLESTHYNFLTLQNISMSATKTCNGMCDYVQEKVSC